MIYICVRTYGNGAWQNKIYPVYYKSLREAKAKLEDLNMRDKGEGEWVLFPLYNADKW